MLELLQTTAIIVAAIAIAMPLHSLGIKMIDKHFEKRSNRRRQIRG